MGLIQVNIDETLLTEQVFGNVGLLKCPPARMYQGSETQPYCVHTARRIPRTLFPIVQENLEQGHWTDGVVIANF